MRRVIPPQQTPSCASLRPFVTPVCDRGVVQQRAAPIRTGQIVAKYLKQEGANDATVRNEDDGLPSIGLTNALDGAGGACRELLPAFTVW